MTACSTVLQPAPPCSLPTNFLYMSGHISDNTHLEEKWVWQALRQMVFLEGPYLMGESRQTYEQLLRSLGPSDLFASLSNLKNDDES